MRDLVPGAYGLVVMGVFLLVLLVPFAYLLSTGALDWGPVKQVLSRAGATRAARRGRTGPRRARPRRVGAGEDPSRAGKAA